MTQVEHQWHVSAATYRPSLAHKIALSLVVLTMTGGAVVFTEPAPFDVLALGLLVLLPAVGLVRTTPSMLAYAAASLIPVACAFFAVLAAINPSRALTHTLVSLFLMLVSFTVTAFVLKSPERHARLVVTGTMFAALIAACAGLAGYLGLFPGAYDIFTLYGRASGTFKDPNVFGAFLMMPAVYLLHLARTTRGIRALVPFAGFAVLSLAVLLSFSRGAWFGLAFSASVYGYLSFVTAAAAAERMRLLIGFAGAVIGAVILVGVALQFDSVAQLLSERATLSQSYDEGPEGRFGGQEKAKRLILSNPFGIGAQQFDSFYHLEEAHNVYLSMFMNAGWLGGMTFAMIVAATVVFGLKHALQSGSDLGLFRVVYAAFVAHALEGFIIDLDHWRHFHLLMALCWGLMLSDRQTLTVADGTRRRVREARTLFAAQPHIAS
jgi:O-antigen ligase